MITRLNQTLAAKKAARDEGDKGFTLIELLVVVLIIGVLAAIAIPVFLGQQQGAQDAAAKSDLTNAKIAVIAFAASNDGDYPDQADITAGTLDEFGFVSTTGTDPSLSGTAGVFCLTVQSASGTWFSASDALAPSEGGCNAGVKTSAQPTVP